MSLLESTLSKKNSYSDKLYPKSNIIPITNDAMFLAMFNNKKRKKYVCYFLSTFLGLDYNDLYNNINLENDVLPKEFKESKKRIVDFVCKYKEEFYLIEMNNQNDKDYMKRNIDSMNRLYGFPVENKGYVFNKVTLININNFYFKGIDEEINDYLYKDVNNNVLTEELKIIDISLPKLKEKYYTNINKLTKCEKFLLACLEEDNDKLDKIIKEGDEILMEYRDEAKRVSKKLTVRDVLEEGNRNFIRMMEAKAMDRGMEKGIEKGVEQEKEQIVRNMLRKNTDINFISEVTGISESKIASLKF